MNKAELIEKVKANLKQSVFYLDIRKTAVEHMLSVLADVAFAALFEGDEVPLPGLGKLVVVQRAARTGRNPRTGAEVKIDASKVVKFKLGKALKESLNGGGK